MFYLPLHVVQCTSLSKLSDYISLRGINRFCWILSLSNSLRKSLFLSFSLCFSLFLSFSLSPFLSFFFLLSLSPFLCLLLSFSLSNYIFLFFFFVPFSRSHFFLSLFFRSPFLTPFSPPLQTNLIPFTTISLSLFRAFSLPLKNRQQLKTSCLLNCVFLFNSSMEC